MTTTERNIHLGVLGASLALAVWVFGVEPRSAEPATRSHAHSGATDERSPLSVIPPGSAFLLSVDVRALRRSPLGAFLAEALSRTSASKVDALCGFNPLARLDQLALAVPNANLAAQEHPEDFGLVASGRFRATEIMRCANAAIAASGGEAVPSKLGSFDFVRARSSTEGEIAAKDGLLVVSGGSYFRELLAAAEGHTPSVAPGANANASDATTDTRHAKLRRALGPAPLLATWVLGEHWLERFSDGETNARLSPLSALKSLAARVDLGETARLLVLLDCTDGEGATRISGLLGDLRASLSAVPIDPQLLGIAKRITVRQTAARLQLELELNQAELAPVLDVLAP